MCGCDKGKDGGNGGNGGSNSSNKHTCKSQKFTLIHTYKFESGKTEKLKKDFYSRPSVQSCNHARGKDFKRAHKKLIKDYENSLKGNKDKSKSVDKINSFITQVVSSSNGCPKCEFCLLDPFICQCGCNTRSSSGKEACTYCNK